MIPSFVRINLYRATNMAQGNAGFVPESAGECRICAEQLPEQQAFIYQRIVQNGKITSSEVESLLGVKQRRARLILKAMTEKGVIKKVGAARTTKYVLSES